MCFVERKTLIFKTLLILHYISGRTSDFSSLNENTSKCPEYL